MGQEKTIASCRQDRLPDVIGIGCRRCGTSWLHKCLNAHPEVGKPENGLHFFSENFEKGLPWYVESLASAADRRVLLEFSVSYSYPEFANDAARRISELVPDALLFVALRNPVERAFSDFRRSLSMLEIPPKATFSEAIAKDPRLISRGKYATLLKRYLDRVPREKLLIINFDDIRTDPSGAFAGLQRFIGTGSVIPAVNSEIRTGGRPRWETLQQVIYGTKDLAHRCSRAVHVERPWNNLCRVLMPMYHRVLGWNLAIERGPSIEDERRLLDIYAPDIEELESLVGLSFSNWLRPGSDT